ncbi:MAG: hypothetical protein IPG50_34085 [Myxococcales bacterium]|nr:hypothetical protein [Myxococcales bacterium]
MQVELARPIKNKASSPERALAELAHAHDLLTRGEDGILRVPFLVRGKLRVPEAITREAIDHRFRELDAEAGPSDGLPGYARVGGAQVLREVVTRPKIAGTPRFVYTVMPVFEPDEVIERDVAALAEELYDLPVTEIVAYADGLAKAYRESLAFINTVRDATRLTAELPDEEHDLAFATVPMLLDGASLKASVDHELCAWGHSGSELLDGWRAIDAAVMPAPVHATLARALAAPFVPREAEIRAMPTRQLHITAGNAPHIPFFSAMRAIATKSAAVVKSPSGATIPGALLALLALASNPDHPITKHLSFVYWPGGDESVEGALFMPGAFDRVVVWGAPGAVSSVRSRAVGTKVVTLDPRYGVSMIGRELFAEADLGAVASRVVADALVANQKACIASQVVYVEGGHDADVARFAEALRAALHAFDEASPNVIADQARGDVLRLLKGRLLDADWYTNESGGGAFSSAVVVCRDEFSMASHPMCRFLVVRPVADLDELVKTGRVLHHGVSTVSVWPEPRRKALRTAIAAQGVSNVPPLGQSGTGFSGQPHDGMRVLSELVDWKNA